MFIKKLHISYCLDDNCWFLYFSLKKHEIQDTGFCNFHLWTIQTGPENSDYFENMTFFYISIEGYLKLLRHVNYVNIEHHQCQSLQDNNNNSPVLFSVWQRPHSLSPWLLLTWAHLGLWPWKHILQRCKNTVKSLQ